jgi:putative tricarboxylic transport membrane protein
MRRADLIVAALCFIAAAVVLQQSLPHFRIERGTVGPGVYPCYIAAVLALCGVSIVIHWFKGNRDVNGGSFFPRGRAAKLLILTIIGLVAYRIGMDILGFPLASLLVMMYLMRLLGRHPWWKTVLYSLIFVGLVSYTFRQWLYMDLPRGLLGI